MPQFSYSNWDGSQHVLDLDAESLLEAMSDDLLEEGDLWRALQRLFRQGAQNQEGQRMPGLQDLLQQLRQKRQQQLQRSNLGDTLKDIREKLQEIQKTERQGIDNKVDDGKDKARARARFPSNCRRPWSAWPRSIENNSINCLRMCLVRSRDSRTTTSWTRTRGRCSRN